MLTPASHITPRARGPRAGALRVLGPTSAALVRHRQQSRGFRFGMWSSYFDPELHREIRRRYRALKCKHHEMTNRRLSWSWENYPISEDTKKAFKYMARDYCHPRHARRGNKLERAEGPHQTPDNPTGVRPGQNIEDAERGPMEHLLFGDKGKSPLYEYDYWATPLQKIKRYMAEQREQLMKSWPSRGASSPSSDETPGESTDLFVGSSGGVRQDTDVEYVIDPITNRKVSKSTSPLPKSTLSEDSVEIPVKTFKSYKSQFAPFQPPPTETTQQPLFYDGPPPASELKKYNHVKLDPKPWDVESKQAATRASAAEIPQPEPRAPVLESDEYSKNHAVNHSSNISTIEGDNFITWKYKGIFWSNHESAPPESTETASKEARDGDGLFPFWPDTQTAQAPPRYSDLDKYKPIMSNEDVAAAMSTPQYDDLSKYKPVEEEPKPVTETETTPHDDLSGSKAARYAESDSKSFTFHEEGTPEELAKYKAVRHNEPDGKPLDVYEETHVEELKKYNAFRFQEPDGEPRNSQASKHDQAELTKYQTIRYNEPDGKVPLTTEEGYRDPAEVRKYDEVRFNEPDCTPPGQAVENLDPAELGKYQPSRHNEPDGKSRLTAEDGRKDPAEMSKYKAFRYNEPDGKAATATADLKDSNFVSKSRTATQDLENLDNLRASDVRARVGGSQFAKTQPEKSNYRKMLKSLMPRYRWTPAIESQDAGKALSDAPKGIVTSEREQASPVKSLIGNYARDFPEEFERSWSTEGSASKVNVYPSGEQNTYEQAIQRAEREHSEGASFDGLERLQPALERQKTATGFRKVVSRQQAEGDPYSKEPQGLQTSYKEECAGKPTWPTYVKVYGSVNVDQDAGGEASLEVRDEELVREIKQIYEDSYGPIESKVKTTKSATKPDSSANPSVPMIYKILAYDPTMQMINTAETTSIVADSASPLTPAEVLLRLSNPSKFFPHFGPLQAQGYEIVSGSGDVLVFRKVRDAAAKSSGEPAEAAPATPAASADKPPASTSEPPPSPPGPVNPIDLMGRRPFAPSNNPAGNFASPTGYVNYDLPPLEQAAASPSSSAQSEPPRFRSGIDVRREEPVFSGAKAAEKKGSSKKSLGKRVVVGAVWVAGLSYALGVMGEYFQTGGIDGMGPKGF